MQKKANGCVGNMFITKNKLYYFLLNRRKNEVPKRKSLSGLFGITRSW